jgi:hypothetical protein
MRTNEVKEEQEDEEDEKNEAERPPSASRSPPRLKRRQGPYSGTCHMTSSVHGSILESNLSSPSDESKLSCWNLAMFCQNLCSCCHRMQKSRENRRTSVSGRIASPNKTH